MSARERLNTLIDDRQALGRVLSIIGIVGMAAALIVGVAGWFITGRAHSQLATTVDPVADLLVDLGDSVEATELIVTTTVEAIESIESATSSGAGALDSVGQVIGNTANVVRGDLAGSIESVVDSLPALVDTGRVIDRTMRALSLVGVDYNPEVPLNEALTDLEQSLRPMPDELRSQADALTAVRQEIDLIAVDADALAVTLEDALGDMAEAELVLESTAENVARAADSVTAIESELSTYNIIAKIAVVAAALALFAAALASLLLGLHFRRSRIE